MLAWRIISYRSKVNRSIKLFTTYFHVIHLANRLSDIGFTSVMSLCSSFVSRSLPSQLLQTRNELCDELRKQRIIAEKNPVSESDFAGSLPLCLTWEVFLNVLELLGSHSYLVWPLIENIHCIFACKTFDQKHISTICQFLSPCYQGTNGTARYTQ